MANRLQAALWLVCMVMTSPTQQRCATSVTADKQCIAEAWWQHRVASLTAHVRLLSLSCRLHISLCSVQMRSDCCQHVKHPHLLVAGTHYQGEPACAAAMVSLHLQPTPSWCSTCIVELSGTLHRGERIRLQGQLFPPGHQGLHDSR